MFWDGYSWVGRSMLTTIPLSTSTSRLIAGGRQTVDIDGIILIDELACAKPTSVQMSHMASNVFIWLEVAYRHIFLKSLLRIICIIKCGSAPFLFCNA
jgi:hypothetical protein